MQRRRGDACARWACMRGTTAASPWYPQRWVHHSHNALGSPPRAPKPALSSKAPPPGPRPAPSIPPRPRPTWHHGVGALAGVPEQLRRTQARAGPHHALGGLPHQGGRRARRRRSRKLAARTLSAGHAQGATACQVPQHLGRAASQPVPSQPHMPPPPQPSPRPSPQTRERAHTCGTGTALGLSATRSSRPSAGMP